MEGEFYRLARVPLFEEVTLDQIAWERLGGLTNKNYKITLEEHSYVLRVTDVIVGLRDLLSHRSLIPKGR